ncbi:SpoIIE family protein phosphatase [Streptomyces sp. NPDC048636]|uniref:SpoIIE family protein phosphatase n=1 Tax=Streptomyces sp. NPDC048636 TaxID=3155762 RepID=UPI00341D8C8E
MPTPSGTDGSTPHSLAVVRALLARQDAGLVITDGSLRVLRSNIGPEMFGGGGVPPGSRFHEFFAAHHAAEVERQLRRVAQGGGVLSGWEVPGPAAVTGSRPSVLSMWATQLVDDEGRPLGLVVNLIDVSEEHHGRHRLELLYRAADQIGSSLDVQRTAQDLVDLLVPSLGEYAMVLLAESVLAGGEAPDRPGIGRHHLRCAAVRARHTWPDTLIAPGEQLPSLPESPRVLSVMQEGNAVVTDTHQLRLTIGERSRLATALIPTDGNSSVIAPLFARGRALGSILLWRTQEDPQFGVEDARLVYEITSRAALSVDNARRFTREHRAAVALQRSLLPPPSTETTAARTAGVYQPASSGTSIGGDWFDVIPLSSLRVALVVGDVVGHGLRSAATMGRLRTGIRTVAGMDLAPDELLTHLDDLVQQLIAEAAGAQQMGIGATCLYAVYDPVLRRCALASAGHPPPLLVAPDGTAEFLEVAPGPPLGVGGMPFEMTEVEVAPGSLLVLFTDGLLEAEDADVAIGMERLKAAVTDRRPLDGDLAGAAARIVDQLSPSTSRDDRTLLLARTAAVAAADTACWRFPADPEVVARAREHTVDQLAAWGMEDLSFVAELVVSELVTNAVRYAGGPIEVRLIRDRILICEVSDPSNTQPRLRRARSTDEGGRGLFLVAQLTTRWGCRYGPEGKTIWTEQDSALHGARGEPLDDMAAGEGEQQHRGQDGEHGRR